MSNLSALCFLCILFVAFSIVCDQSSAEKSAGKNLITNANTDANKEELEKKAQKKARLKGKALMYFSHGASIAQQAISEGEINGRIIIQVAAVAANFIPEVGPFLSIGLDVLAYAIDFGAAPPGENTAESGLDSAINELQGVVLNVKSELEASMKWLSYEENVRRHLNNYEDKIKGVFNNKEKVFIDELQALSKQPTTGIVEIVNNFRNYFVDGCDQAKTVPTVNDHGGSNPRSRRSAHNKEAAHTILINGASGNNQGGSDSSSSIATLKCISDLVLNSNATVSIAKSVIRIAMTDSMRLMYVSTMAIPLRYENQSQEFHKSFFSNVNETLSRTFYFVYNKMLDQYIVAMNLAVDVFKDKVGTNITLHDRVEMDIMRLWIENLGSLSTLKFSFLVIEKMSVFEARCFHPWCVLIQRNGTSLIISQAGDFNENIYNEANTKFIWDDERKKTIVEFAGEKKFNTLFSEVRKYPPYTSTEADRKFESWFLIRAVGRKTIRFRHIRPQDDSNSQYHLIRMTYNGTMKTTNKPFAVAEIALF